MIKVRVYEVARELGLENTELMKRVERLGIQVKNHMSSLEAVDIDRVKRALEKDKLENTVEERIRPTVVRRRTVAAPPKAEEPVVAPEPPAPPPPPRAVVSAPEPREREREREIEEAPPP